MLRYSSVNNILKKISAVPLHRDIMNLWKLAFISFFKNMPPIKSAESHYASFL